MTAAALRYRIMPSSIFLLIVFFPLAHAQTAVPTWHYDNARTGVNASEMVLTPYNVKSTTFGKLFSRTLDGAVIGQALYLPDVTIPGKGTHNVVYVATMHDSVYAFDADSNTGSNSLPLWHKSFLTNGAAPMPMNLQGCQTTTRWSEVGIVSTPVIDRVAGTIFVVAKTYEHGAYVHRIHALDVKTGLERTNSPKLIKASFQFGGVNNIFKDYMQVNRPALLLENGHIYIAFGSNGCRGSKEQGWILSYLASTLEYEGAFDDEPSGSAAAIWQRGGGLSADSVGDIYGTTADGDFVSGSKLGQLVIKIKQSGSSLDLDNWFTPFNELYLDNHDLDFAEPVLVLPNQPGPHPHLIVAVGKEGTLYLLNRDDMGNFCTGCIGSDSQIVQELPEFAKETGALIYFNGTVYTSGAGSPIKILGLNQGLLTKAPLVQSKDTTQGHSPIISANGTTNAVLWQMTGSILLAFDAKSLVKIYSSTAAPNLRDVLPVVPHFANFVVVNGKVYIGYQQQLNNLRSIVVIFNSWRFKIAEHARQKRVARAVRPRSFLARADTPHE